MTAKTPDPPPTKRSKSRRQKRKHRPYSNRGKSVRVSRCNTIDAVHYCACETMSKVGPTAVAKYLTELGFPTTRQAVFNWRRFGCPLHFVKYVAKLMGVPRGLLSPTHFGNCDCWRYGKLLEMSGLANKE